MRSDNFYATISSMNTIAQLLPIAQIILSVLLIITIIFQRSGAGIEGALGGTATEMTRFTRRGSEQFLFFASIIIAILFVASAVIGILMS